MFGPASSHSAPALHSGRMAFDLEPLVALNLTGLVGAVLHRRLVERFGSAKAALQAPEIQLKGVQGVGDVTAKAIADVARSGAARKELDRCAEGGIQILAHGTPAYPAALANLADAPLVLYVKGSLQERDQLAIGVVGSRQCTPYGERQAARFATELAGLGVTVVSGLARGVDTRAHQAALKAHHGRTIAVLGSGLLQVYPPENQELAGQIAARGAVLSEFPLDATPEPANFPRRNRIVSGLSLGILVVEASEKSGALITADWAMEQGREVFALPGNVENPLCRGSHLLVKQGAKLVETPMDVLEELPALQPLLRKMDLGTFLSPLERTVLSALGDAAKAADAVAAAVKLPEVTVSSVLDRLAARGLASEEAKGFRKTPRPVKT